MSTNDIRIGDIIRLNWYGDRAIPKTLGNTTATVTGFTRSRWKVKADQDCCGDRFVSRRHIAAVLRNGEWVKVT